MAVSGAENPTAPHAPSSWWLLLAACAAGCAAEPGEAAPRAGADGGRMGPVGHDSPPEKPCATCHPNHVSEWSLSPHAYSMRDPVFHAMVRLGQAETEGALGQFCTECHSPIGARTNQTTIAFDEAEGIYQQATEGLDADAMAGVSCDVCHGITKVTERFNAKFEMELDGVRRATIRDPVESGAHESQYSPLHADSDICGTCHQVVNDFGVALERTMGEWVQSTFPGRKECQDCHMAEYEGPAAVGGPVRKVHRHDFVGVDVSLLPPEAFPGYEELRDRTQALLEESAVLTVVPIPAERALSVEIQNLAGHALPSGATADREMWLEVLIEDASGAVVFESGTLDDHGDLRIDDPLRTSAPGTDPALVLYSQKMYFDPSLADPPSNEPRRRVDFLWQPNAEESHLVYAGGRDESRYDLAALPAGAYTASVRLLFRSFPPHLLRILEAEAGLDPDVAPRVPLMEMEAAAVAFELP